MEGLLSMPLRMSGWPLLGDPLSKYVLHPERSASAIGFEDFL